jgi:Arc/MetJ-type ribon-helix-helix transcriptional regulator
MLRSITSERTISKIAEVNMKKTTHSRISATLSKDLLAQVDALVKVSDNYSNRSVLIEDALAQFLKAKGIVIQPIAAAEEPADSPPPAEHHDHEGAKPKEHHGHDHEDAKPKEHHGHGHEDAKPKEHHSHSHEGAHLTE